MREVVHRLREIGAGRMPKSSFSRPERTASSGFPVRKRADPSADPLVMHTTKKEGRSGGLDRPSSV